MQTLTPAHYSLRPLCSHLCVLILLYMCDAGAAQVRVYDGHTQQRMLTYADVTQVRHVYESLMLIPSIRLAVQQQAAVLQQGL